MRQSALTLVLFSAVFAAHAAPRGFTVEDLVALDRVSAPMFSPDGRRVVYGLREADVEANKASNSLWIVDAKPGATPRRLTAKGSSASSPVFSSDGSVLYFLSARSGSNQVWRLPLYGGEAQQVTHLPLDVGSYRLSPDGKTLAVSLEVFPDCDSLDCTVKRLDEEAKRKSTGVVYDKLFVRHWDTWADGRRNQLYTVKIGADGVAGDAVLVSRDIDGDVPSKPFGGSDEYTFSPDGGKLIFSARIAGKTEAWSTNFDLFEVAANGSTKPRNLTPDNPAWDTAPMFSADGKKLYYLAMKRPGFEADRFAIMEKDLATGATREVAPNWDRSPAGISLSPDGSKIYADVDDIGQHLLYAIDIATGNATKITSEGAVASFDLTGDALVYAKSALNEPANLYLAKPDGSAATKLVSFNEAKLADVKFGDFEQFNFPGWNDETVYGYVVKPWNYTKGKKYPVAFIIHGGPQGSSNNLFHYRWNPQTYAGAGFAVVEIDFHGSTGYGQAFTDSISGDWGGKPLEDLQKGWAAALAKYDFLDGEKACALGASYGGFMINWIAGNWNDHWKCLVNHDGVFDTRSMAYVTEELWFDEWENGGTQYENPENYEKFNPVNHVAKWHVPMLVVQGQQDFRVPLDQGLSAFTALQRRGIQSKFLYFPDENHWVLRIQNSLQWHHEVLDWLKRWTK